jgi:serine/threonine-protein kinase HipA
MTTQITPFERQRLAKKVGIRVPEVRLFPSKEETGYFGSLRFDRFQDQRIHTIALSSLLETTHRIPNLDYAHAFEVISLISVNQDDQYELFRRMYFNVLVQNKDDHGKNMSFIYDETKKGYVLAPAYDITSTPNKFEHEMTILGNGKPTKDDVTKIAIKLGLKKAKTDEIVKTIETKIKS